MRNVLKGLSKNVVQIGNLATLVRLYSDGQYKLSQKDKEHIYETFKSLYDDQGKLIREDTAKPELDQSKDSAQYKNIQDLAISENPSGPPCIFSIRALELANAEYYSFILYSH